MCHVLSHCCTAVLADQSNFGGLDFDDVNLFSQDDIDCIDFNNNNIVQNTDQQCNYFNTTTIDNIYSNNLDRDNALKLIHLNVRGLSTNYNNLILYLNTLTLSFDIICLSEVHLQQGKTYLDTDRFHINGYKTYKVFSTISYGGCVIYVRENFNSQVPHHCRSH